MSRPRPSIRAELAAAVRAVNAAYYRLPEDRRPSIAYDHLDQELEIACTGGDRDRALAAIDRWKRHWLDTFRGRAEG
jgi:hypothetical protein